MCLQIYLPIEGTTSSFKMFFYIKHQVIKLYSQMFGFQNVLSTILKMWKISETK